MTNPQPRPVAAESWIDGNLILSTSGKAHRRRRDEAAPEWPIPRFGATGIWPSVCGRDIRGVLASSAGSEGLCRMCYPPHAPRTPR